jgi:YidC/Oxa1 family membrane protein insertase
MNNARLFFLLGLALLGSLLWTEHAKEQAVQAAKSQVAIESSAPSKASSPASTALAGETPSALPPVADVPQASVAPANPEMPISESASSNQSPRIQVRTDVIAGEIDLAGGDFAKLEVVQFKRLQGEGAPRLLSSDPADYARAQSGWVASAGVAPDHKAMYQATAERFELKDGEAELVIPLTWSQDGISVRQQIKLKRGSYVIERTFEISNQSTSPWRASNYRQLQRLPGSLPSGFFVTNPETFAFTGAAVYSPEIKFRKLKFGNFADEPFNQNLVGGWSAMLQHHFVMSFIPSATETVNYSSVVLEPAGGLPQRFMIRQQSPEITVEAGQSATYNNTLFVGPKTQEVLEKLAPGLELTVDYGMLSFISKPLFWVLDKLHSLVANWGFAIILLTLLVKLAMFKLSDAQYRSMAKMRQFQPKMQEIQQRYKDDRQKMSTALMDLYKKEKINPLGGCLPLLIQIPVFIALYWVIFESVELRQAPFMLWIQDLSVKDPYFVLPILNAAIMWYTQKLTPMTGMDPMQVKIFQFMPLVMGLMMAFFPAGLVLYWCAQGALNLAQQAYILRKYATPAK